MTLYKPKDRLLLGGTILLGGLSSLLAAFVSIFLQRVIDVAVAGEIREFYRVLGGMAAFLLAFGVISFSEALLGKILLRNVTRYLRGRVFKGVMKQDPKEYTAQNTADYLSALVNDVKLVEDNYLVPLLLCFQMAVLFLATLGILLYLSPLVTFILLLFLVLLFAVPALGKKLQERQDAYSAQLSSFTAAAKDFLNGYEVIRGYSALHCILGRFHKVNKDTADKKFAADRLMAVNESFSDIFSSLTVIVIVFVAAWQMMQGKVSMGTLLALIQLSGTFVTPVVILMQNIPKIQGIKPVMEHLAELMDISRNEGEDSSRQEYEMQGLQDAIRCTDLTFSYADDQKVLEHEDFLFEAGKKYAVVGQSGCGKSTLIKLLTGYFRDFQGQIEIDGHSLKEMPQEEINRRIAVIHQNVFLFDTDIRDNICLGRQYSDEEIHKALMESGMEDFLAGMEGGIDSKVGENGQLLSGGQRQRIAVARALIRRTPVLILDEGTSAIDRETAFEIEKRLLERRELTVITITHHMDERLEGEYDGILRLGV